MMKTLIRTWVSGREYEVAFDREGLVVSVVNISTHGNRRTTWYFMSNKPMGLTAACAVRGAQRQMKEAQQNKIERL
jgi:hypothetical protein